MIRRNSVVGGSRMGYLYVLVGGLSGGCSAHVGVFGAGQEANSRGGVLLLQ
jgi:hypothetical protein